MTSWTSWKRCLKALAWSMSMLCSSAGAEPERGSGKDLYVEAIHSILEGRGGEATEALARLIEEQPNNAGAWLDLAILHCGLGNAQEAERLFQTIEQRFSPPPGIMEILALHREQGCKRAQPRDQLTLMLARGFDNNVNQGASSPIFSIGSGSRRIEQALSPEYLPQRDQYTLLSGEYVREFADGAALAFAQIRSRENDSLKQYNTTSVIVGLERPWKLETWQGRSSAFIGGLTLGGKLYQKQIQLHGQVTPPLALPEPFKFNLLGGISRLQYTTLANYNATTYEAGGSLVYQDRNIRAQATASYLLDHGNAARLGGDRHGWTTGINGTFKLAGNATGELGWTYQTWQGENIYSPELIDVIRRQKTNLWRAALTLPVHTNHSIRLEYRQVSNHENISLFQYNSRLFQISWLWSAF